MHPKNKTHRVFTFGFLLSTFFSYLCIIMSGNEKTYNFRPLFRKFANKYTISGLIFLIWIAFLDKNSIVEKVELRNKISTLEKEQKYYQDKIEDDNRKIKELLSSPDNLEKFAREQYFMKNPNEDIFVITKKP